MTFLLVTILEANFNKYIDEQFQKIKELQGQQNNIKTFRRYKCVSSLQSEGEEFETREIDLKAEDLVVGDIYNYKDGMRIPADSVILEVDDKKKDGLIECNEGDVTGYYCQ